VKNPGGGKVKTGTILLVADKPLTRGGLRDALISRGSNIIDVQGRDKAIEVLRVRTVDLILLDTTTGGLEICRAIRTAWDVPMIVVSARDADKEKVEALDAGADDFIARPFCIDELMARIRAALRRSGFATDILPNRALLRLPCGHFLTEDQILSMAAEITAARRETSGCEARPGVGRPKKMVTCRKCGEVGGTLAMRSHKCRVEGVGSIAAYNRIFPERPAERGQHY
jgi:DNA-binding response OmpR family regulator